MSRKSFTYKAVTRSVGKAIHEYDMVSDGDRILVAVSGGKDSMAMLWTLAQRQKRVPIRYRLFPVYLDPGFEDGFAEKLKGYCNRIDQQIHVEFTDYGVIGHGPKNRENPCFLCARLRRKRLFEIADELGCRKIALGHNKDDLIETLFLNICYTGEISTMVPSQSFFKGSFTVVRPMAFTDENVIQRFIDEREIPVFQSSCPSAGTSKRNEIKDMLHRLYRTNRKIKGNIFRSLSHVNQEYMLK